MEFTARKFDFAVTPSTWPDATFTEPVQTRFPRSKRRRIRRKWAKDPRNFEQRPLTAAKLTAIIKLASDKMQRALEARIWLDFCETYFPLDITYEPSPEPRNRFRVYADAMPFVLPRISGIIHSVI